MAEPQLSSLSSIVCTVVKIPGLVEGLHLLAVEGGISKRFMSSQGLAADGQLAAFSTPKSEHNDQASEGTIIDLILALLYS